jgi:dTDP-4-dehydrorhamnose reductase
MLGRRVVATVDQVAEAIPISERSDGSVSDPLLEALEFARPDWIINCAGQLDQLDPDLFIANSLLPLRLAARWPGRVILASSDAVFASRGQRLVSEPPDAVDAYGLSKRLGEAVGAHVIRCSIVDPAGGLLARAAASLRFTGYTNHLWNGITTANWTSIALLIIGGELGGTVQPGSPIVTKYELLRTAARLFKWPTRIERGKASEAMDRTLIPTISFPPIEDQLAEMAQ